MSGAFWGVLNHPRLYCLVPKYCLLQQEINGFYPVVIIDMYIVCGWFGQIQARDYVCRLYVLVRGFLETYIFCGVERSIGFWTSDTLRVFDSCRMRVNWFVCMFEEYVGQWSALIMGMVEVGLV
eukprot:TRINITY_DN1011_c0_g1_i10.p7 TRINITY_DN1011_c0_g1~~TRINITY_DN1011_c0_g1_i10.p7  ORF type:complete len:124 (-),score=12.17 TRINITY_DN1011_c0_g1_i10:106-477(-)